MNVRRIIYITALVIVGLVVYYSGNSDPNLYTAPSISRQTIVNDFKDLTHHEQDLKSLTGTFHTTDVFFPKDFTGNQGDEFYVTIQSGQKVATLKYVIKAKNGNQSKTKELEYKLKDTWEDFKPPQGQFETYHINK